jgi:phosphoglycolate phosphatase-like HAD superfamily hydrolase
MDIIFDIDGTLLDISHRLHYLGLKESTAPSERAKPKASRRWEEFRDPKLKKYDVPIMPVITVAQTLAKSGNQIIFLSGRIRDEAEGTIESLQRFFEFDKILNPNKAYDQTNFKFGKQRNKIPLYMRANKDYKQDTITKSDLYQKVLADGYEPAMVFDDRPSVIRMWRSKGLLVADVGKGVDF